jgi:cytochrome c553
MPSTRLNLAALTTGAVLLVAAVAMPAVAIDPSRNDGDNVKAKMGYCTDCHGASGRGYYGYLTMPRLAGQQPEYLENQLKAFAQHRRTNTVLNMWRVHSLSASLRATIAARFSRLNPPSMHDGPRRLVAAGKRLFEVGDPEGNIPACAACHGPDASGFGQNARLAGQLYPYTVRRLLDLRRQSASDDGGSDAAAIMGAIARSLSKSQREALAAYVANLN